GDELAEDEAPRSPAIELELRLADARVRRERDLAQELEDSEAAPPPRKVPGAIGERAGGERHGEDREARHLPFGGERARDDERGNGGDRHARLLEQHVREHQREAVAGDEGNRIHGRRRSGGIARCSRYRTSFSEWNPAPDLAERARLRRARAGLSARRARGASS